MRDIEETRLSGNSPNTPRVNVVVGPVLPTVATVCWIVVFMAASIPALFSAMLFDSGGSLPAYAIYIGLWATLPLCFISVIASWVLWATTRSINGSKVRVIRGVVYLLPVVSLAVAGVGLLWIGTACAGNLSC